MTQPSFVPIVEADQVRPALRLSTPGPWTPSRVAEITGLRPDQISIKATTTERMGFCGREEGIAAMAVVLLFAPA